MEPIKVDFSESGKKKNVKDILIPPEKAGLKMIINIAVALLTAAIAYYFMLPPMNPHAYQFYLFWVIVAASFVISAFITSGAFRKPEYVPYVKRRSRIPVMIAGAIVLVLAIGWLISSPFFRAKKYAQILKVDPANFSDAVSVITDLDSFNQIALIDTETARELADRSLGDFAMLGLESQFELLEADSTQINFKNSPYRIYPLQYGDIFKWFKNSVADKNFEGIPGYVKVNLNTQQTELVTDYKIRYSTAEHFGERLERVLRFRHPTAIFGEISFEIDDNGRPYWIVEDIKKTVGLFGGDDVQGIFLVDAETGKDTYYTAEQLKTGGADINWIDQAYDSDLLVKQYNYLGKYGGGFWNSLIGQSGVRKASDGYSFIVNDDDVYLYTGVTSVTADNSILGFVLINQRTKEAAFYETSGATEASAQKSAEGKVQDKGWKAAFPILLNIGSEPTYFMSLKDEGSVVKSYAMVNVKNYTVVAIPKNENTDLRSCMQAYLDDMNEISPNAIRNFSLSGNPGKTPETDETETQPVTGTVTEIRTAVVSGNTYYYIELDGSGVYYCVAAGEKDPIVLLNVGDAVTVTPAETAGEGARLISAETVAPAAAGGEESGTSALPEEAETSEQAPAEWTTVAAPEETTAG